ncbi:unnamed protein product [Dibothriocephalus latus]|uniref:Uncharacterized protein n=1 Tax=Dibothriocephalus latus TaxID=60516 RepID=A0A3P7P7J2_DIBLA|nr:unnamed protein product [Dibothriocephalus latus]
MLFKLHEIEILAQGDVRVIYEPFESWFPGQQSINKRNDLLLPSLSAIVADDGFMEESKTSGLYYSFSTDRVIFFLLNCFLEIAHPRVHTDADLCIPRRTKLLTLSHGLSLQHMPQRYGHSPMER